MYLHVPQSNALQFFSLPFPGPAEKLMQAQFSVMSVFIISVCFIYLFMYLYYIKSDYKQKTK